MADPAGWQRAFLTQGEFVRKMLRRYGVPPADVDDLAQDVFVVMCRRWADYRRDRPLRNWLLGITLRVAQSHNRRSGRYIPGAVPEEPDSGPQPDDQLSQAETWAIVSRAFARLPERHRSILRMHELEGLSVREIASLQARPLFTVYGRLSRARREFERALRRTRIAPALIPLFWRRGVDPGEGGRPDAGSGARGAVAAPSPVPLPLPLPRVAAKTGLLSVAALGVAVMGAVALLAAGARTAGALTGAHHPRLQTAAARTPPVPHAPALRPAGFAVSPSAAVDLARGLIGYWSLDDGPGSAIARDQSANAGHCQVRGAVAATDWIDGVRGKALSLGGRAWLQCPGGPTAGLDRQMSLALWIQPGDSARGIRALVNRQLAEGRQDRFFLGLDDHSLETSSHLWKGVVSRPLPLAPGRWVHVAVVHDEWTTRLFVQGLEIGSKGTRGVSLGGGSAPLMVGGGANGPDPDQVDERFEGAVDELVLYDRALSEAEVQALAARDRPPR